ncbi:hypothetical protein IRY55_11365 [Savagea sp. SN6]|uniref:Integral membrane protein n=1 Tax=Savagea serpentis TaxID=2785297 RepID=A0A8J7KLZ6_9BACL|nr:hypothetical protein [Savagea serpentis]MBF4501964.1 hypothetical protein [Savagea serpentis]
MLNIIIQYSWGIFIFIEVLSLLALILFGVARYFFDKTKLSLFFISFFLFLLIIEGALAFYIYIQTGEISTIQIVITIFILYACTFGILDFINLDRWMRQKIGTLRGIELLTKKDYEIINKKNDAKYISRKYRRTSVIHLIVFLTVQIFLWTLGTTSFSEMKMYLSDFSWVESGDSKLSPYPNNLTLGIGVIWGIVFIVDFVYSWCYILFSRKS